METYSEKNFKTMNPRIWLSEEFAARRRKNQAYSMRAFANFLKLDASTVSQILAGKRHASAKMVSRLADTLGVDPDTKSALMLVLFFR